RETAATNWMSGDTPWTLSTSVFPHHPNPTCAALIIAVYFFLMALGPHPQRELTADPSLGPSQALARDGRGRLLLNREQRPLRIGRHALGEREPEFLLHQVDALDERHHLVERVPPAHAFAAHAAVGAEHQPLRRNDLQRLADDGRH